VAMVVSL